MVVLPPIDEPVAYNQNYVFYWNHAGLELNRLTHSLGGPQTGPTVSSRVLGILHLAIHDAYFALRGHPTISTYLDPNATDPAYQLPAIGSAFDHEQAVAGAAITTLEAFYARRNIGSNFAFTISDQLDQLLSQLINRYPSTIDTLSSSYQFGIDVGTAILNLLAIKPGEPGADQGRYQPHESGRFFFRDEPSNPVRLVPVDPNNPSGPKRAVKIYHAPYYGLTAKRFAVQFQVDGSPVEHVVADPPRDTAGGTPEAHEYVAAVREVRAVGGAPTLNTTTRTPDQTTAAYFWAYDGANLIGTPPRLYNQIIRKIAWDNTVDSATAEDNTDEFVRLFALVNAALADAGIFCWQEKYNFEFWRPLSGVREHDLGSGPASPLNAVGSEHIDPVGDPFWLSLGAPETNTDRVSFKPPFPAYPSGHATFGAAAFQIARLYYRTRDGLSFADNAPDEIAFSFISEELNGVSRDLRQPYEPSQPITDQPGVVRTRIVRRFKNLWAAIFENAASRVWLGVHWRFDAFPAADAIDNVNPDGSTIYRDSDQINYGTRGPRSDRLGQFPIGGAPLGIEIANDIFQGGLNPTPANRQPSGRERSGDPLDATQHPLRPGYETPKASQTNIR